MFVTLGVGSTCSPRETTGVGCTRSPGKKRHHSRTKVPVLAAQQPPLANGCGLYLQPDAKADSNPSRMNTYAKRPANPCAMNTYKIIGLKGPWNEHLQKIGGWGVLLLLKSPAHTGTDRPAAVELVS